MPLILLERKSSIKKLRHLNNGMLRGKTACLQKIDKLIKKDLQLSAS
jgi:hypothetical protein